MPLLGAHMSIAGGFHKAASAAAELGMDTVQIFTSSPQMWPVSPRKPPAGKPPTERRSVGRSSNTEWIARSLTSDEVGRFKDCVAEHQLARPVAHASYLINLASPDDQLRERSIAALVVELERADQLGLFGVIVHPGSHTTLAEEDGLRNVARSLDEVHRRTPRLAAWTILENTAGQGTNLGWRFEHLATVLTGVNDSARVRVCIDTCHALAAGYPLARETDYEETIDRLDRLIGLDRVAAWHLNDSKRELGSRVDRHEHIGKGKLGRAAFRNVLRDPRWATTPMYLETPKGKNQQGRLWDAINLSLLRRLLR